MEQNLIKVTAAVIIKNQKVLIARRKKEQHMGLKWEFPGGKIRENETPTACLIRELEEEFSIKTQIREFFLRSIHHYQDKSIELISYLVDYKAGDFILHDHEEIKWIDRNELERYDFADADIPIVKKLSGLEF